MKENGIFRYVSLNYGNLSNLVKFIDAIKMSSCPTYLTIVTIVTVYFPTDQLTIQWHGKYMQQLYTINYDLYVLKLQ